jgi:hypothetical protein
MQDAVSVSERHSVGSSKRRREKRYMGTNPVGEEQDVYDVDSSGSVISASHLHYTTRVALLRQPAADLHRPPL